MPKWVPGKLKLGIIASSLQEFASLKHVALKKVAVDLPLANGPSVNSADHSLGKTGPMHLEPLLLSILVGDVPIFLKGLQQSMPNRSRPEQRSLQESIVANS